MPRPPTPNPVTSPYGLRKHPIHGDQRMHWGEDRGWDGPAGTMLVAPIDGTILSYKTDGAHGRRLRLGDGLGTIVSLSHTERLWHGVRTGDRVTEGQPIAVMGKTGAVTGVHVHWEIVRDGRFVDPDSWLLSFASIPDPIPIIELLEENTMKILANAEVNQAWRVAGPGIWREVPGGYAAQAIEAFGEPVKVSNVAFDLARKVCLGEPYAG